MKIHYELMLTMYIQTPNKNIEWGNYNATENTKTIQVRWMPRRAYIR